jgi:hypothetical protein
MTRALVALATLLLVGTATARADPQPVEQWAASPETVLDLPRAWEVSQGAGAVDSGVRLSHPVLAPDLWRDPAEIPGDRRDDDGNGYVDDIHGVDLTGEHSLDDGQRMGTHVAGTIAAAQNGKGVVGVAYKAKLMTIRIIDLSLETEADDPAVRAAVREAAAVNVLIICSAGNIDRRPVYPVPIPADNLDSGLRHTRRPTAGPGPHPALDRGLRYTSVATFMTAHGRAAHRARDPGRQSSLPRRGGRNVRLQVGDLVR